MQKPDNYKWYKIAESLGDLYMPEYGLLQLNIKGNKICVGLYKDQLFACAAKCPHAGGNMAEGYLDEQGNIVCPLHRYKYSVQNGRNVSGEGYYLKTWQIENRADGIYISVEKKSFF